MCAGPAVPKASWRKHGGTAAADTFVDRKPNRLVCVLIGFVTFELPEPNGNGEGRSLVDQVF